MYKRQAVAVSNLFNLSVEEIRSEYVKYKLSSVTAYLDWFSLTQNVTFPGMGGKLLKFKRSAGDEAFAERAKELFKNIDDESMNEVKFEITKVMYDNIELFPEETKKLTEIYVTDCIKKLCEGENYDIESIVKASNSEGEQIETIKENLPRYMDIIYNSACLLYTSYPAQTREERKHRSDKRCYRITYL